MKFKTYKEALEFINWVNNKSIIGSYIKNEPIFDRDGFILNTEDLTPEVETFYTEYQKSNKVDFPRS